MACACQVFVGARRYRELQCWQLASQLKASVYEFTAIQTQDHIMDARQLGYLTEPRTTELCHLSNRAIGATTRLLLYLRTRR